MDGPGHNPGGWPGAQSATCVSCGSSVPPAVVCCPQCGRPRAEDALTLLGDTPLPTPLPSSPAGSSEEVTRFAVPAANVKGVVGPHDAADDMTRIVTPEDSSEDVTRFVAPPEASEDVTRFAPANDALTVAASDSPADAMTVATPVTSATAGARRARRTNNAGPLEVGQSFGPRYHIIRLLGAGGMGAVYQAWDAELGVAVAIKVIRPEVMDDPATAEEVGRRFKRELLLARQVTHKNVVRIHDIGDIDGIKYITMSYVEGTDLASILKKDGKRPIPELLGIARSVISGLVAAHTAGVVHRDLKPANIMISKEGEALIMDFGIAHSTGDAGTAPKPGVGVVPEHLTRAASHHAATTLGSIVGTVEYMAPEQARGQTIDQRVDVYAFGLILYDALLGQRRASSGAAAVEELQRRMSAPPPPLQALAPEIPGPLAALVARCVEPDAEKRFQTSAEVAAELDRLDDKGELIPVKRMIGVPLMAAVVTLALAAVGGTWYYQRSLIPPPARDPVLVAIADFDNTTGDSAFDRTIEPIVRRGLEDATFINAYERTRLQSTFGIELPTLDEKEAQVVAANQGLGVVLAGSVSRQGNGYEISVKTTRVPTGEVIINESRRASGKDQVLEETARLIAAVRKALGDPTSDSDQLFAMRTMTATRLDVARYYAAAFEAQSNGNYDEAIKNLQAAITLDPKTSGLGYQGLAILSRNLDRIPEAEEYIKQALNHLDGMTRRESLATRGVAYIIQGNPQRCVEEYGRMLETFAADAIARNQRALCLSKLRKLTEAVADMRQAVRLVPKRALFRANLAVYAAYGGQFQIAEQEALAVKEPFDFATLALAFAQLGRGSVSEADQTYRKLATLGTRGASWSSAGLGDLALYEGRYQDAIRIFEDGAKADLAAEFPERAARKFISIGQAHLLRNEPARAIAAAGRALENSGSTEVRFLAARVLVAAGQTAKAEPIAAALVKELPAEPNTYGRILQGEIALKKGNVREAITVLTEANDPNKGGLDTWLGHFALGQAFLAGEQFLDADSEFDLCIRRKGEALSVLVDESPTFGYLPVVYYYQGQVREAMKTSGFSASYREYLKIRGNSTEDRLVAEARRRAG